MKEEAVIVSNKERKLRQKAAYHAAHRKKPSSSTTGRIKGIVATPLQRSVCRRNRSWKRPDYAAVMDGLGKKAKKTP